MKIYITYLLALIYKVVSLIKLDKGLIFSILFASICKTVIFSRLARLLISAMLLSVKCKFALVEAS